jgi:hypothetical protein
MRIFNLQGLGAPDKPKKKKIKYAENDFTSHHSFLRLRKVKKINLKLHHTKKTQPSPQPPIKAYIVTHSHIIIYILLYILIYLSVFLLQPLRHGYNDLHSCQGAKQIDRVLGVLSPSTLSIWLPSEIK